MFILLSSQIATLGPFFHDVLGGAAITIVSECRGVRYSGS